MLCSLWLSSLTLRKIHIPNHTSRALDFQAVFQQNRQWIACNINLKFIFTIAGKKTEGREMKKRREKNLAGLSVANGMIANTFLSLSLSYLIISIRNNFNLSVHWSSRWLLHLENSSHWYINASFRYRGRRFFFLRGRRMLTSRLSWLTNAGLAIVCPFLERNHSRDREGRTWGRRLKGDMRSCP